MQSKPSASVTPETFTDILRNRFKVILEAVATFLNRLGITPNTLTLTGVIGNLVSAIFLAQGSFFEGGLIALVMGPLDAIDGTMARQRGEPSDFGAFIDSVSDRYSELIIFGGLMLHYALIDDHLMTCMVFAAAAGSVLVSYTRSRAEALGFNVKVGLLTRAERFIVLIPSLVLNYARFGIWAVAILANFTALQRILAVRKMSHERMRGN
ncbi:MAG: CDP-alcohol phosphatidyltransferase family protein [Anaerolineales bacterium]|nr:CDP-alcohol phosphatidyltransferase family protein [Anaerolineales bacterium]